MKKPLAIIFGVLFLDQAFKIWIKTHMYLGEEFNVLGNWFIIHFTENNGMAFGMEFAGQYGKLILSIFRVFAISGIAYYLFTLVKQKANSGYIVAMALIFAGALGNLLDSLFYGIMFDNSYNQIAGFMPRDGGYEGFLKGKVVDMLYFPLIEGHFPAWFPFWGGEDFLFFRPVFNVADSSITVGISLILLFQKRYFAEPENSNLEITATPITEISKDN